MRRRELLTGLAGAATLGATTAAPGLAWGQGQTPAVTKLLVGATPGGGTDLVARALAQELSGRLKRNFVVDNRPGAAGNIAAGEVAKAQADGGTLLLSYTSHAINPALFGKLPFDPVKDFTALSLIATSPLMLVGRPGLKANNLKELIDQAKGGGTSISIAVAGVGSANHLAGEMLRVQTGLEIVSVPYKGASPAVSDVMGNQVDLLFSNMATVQQLVKGGKVKPLAVSTAQRVAGFPEVAPVAELVPGFDYSSWYALFAPAGLSAEAAGQLASATRASLASAEVQQRLQGEGLTPVGNTPEEFAAFLRAEITRWARVVATTGAKLA